MMLKLIAQMIIGVASNALGLLVAAAALNGFSVDGMSFVLAVLIFSVSTVVLGPLILKIAITNAPYLVGGISLVTTLVGLLITNLVSDGISISGLDTWLLATLIIWIFSVIGNLVLPLLIFKKTLQKSKEND